MWQVYERGVYTYLTERGEEIGMEIGIEMEREIRVGVGIWKDTFCLFVCIYIYNEWCFFIIFNILHFV